MEPLLIYYIKINIGIILFYGFYKLFFTRDTLFKMRRSALIAFFVVAFIYPLMNIEAWMRAFWKVDDTIATYNLVMSELLITSEVSDTPFYGTWDNLVFLVLITGSLLLLTRLITDLIRISMLRRKSERI
ncbi:MAG: M56 family metallopeptidase, partial [Bacteroidales bacterium]